MESCSLFKSFSSTLTTLGITLNFLSAFQSSMGLNTFFFNALGFLGIKLKFGFSDTNSRLVGANVFYFHLVQTKKLNF